jgi:disulfide bond formation protein DsbB
MQNAESGGQRSSSVNELLPYAAWVLAVLSMAGSLFFSEVMDLPPCVLCWYQRIAMYPLVLIIGIGIVTKDARWKIYSLPLALIGLVISVYHNLVYYGVIPESLTPCTRGVSCSERQIEWFGIITIPLMGLLSFIAITVAVALFRPKKKL